MYKESNCLTCQRQYTRWSTIHTCCQLNKSMSAVWHADIFFSNRYTFPASAEHRLCHRSCKLQSRLAGKALVGEDTLYVPLFEGPLHSHIRKDHLGSVSPLLLTSSVEFNICPEVVHTQPLPGWR